MFEIGIMQGRLLPRYLNRYQAFPLGYWQAEFFIAKELGLDAIEFILDYNDAKMNPLLTPEGIQEINDVIKKSGIKVKSICADYFMEAPFHGSQSEKSEVILETLLKNAALIGVKDIVIPCVDQSKLKTNEDVQALVKSVNKFLHLAEKNGIFINFETDLPPAQFRELLSNFTSKNIKVNYDIGNSASLGYDPTEEFAAYGEYISDLHIKDRVLGGSSVMLGTGNADFDKVFSLLAKANFKGTVTMQASRVPAYQEEFSHVVQQLNFTKKYIQQYLSNNK